MGRSMRPIFLSLVALFAAASLSAADLGALQEWPDSPMGYFLTKAERAEWASLASEGDAAKFVEVFLAKRDASFPGEVKLRAQQADKYLTIGKLQGSKTLRGKVIVLMGPPTGMNVAVGTKSETKRDNPAVAGALSNIGPSGGGGRNADAGSFSGNSIGTGTEIRTYSISYDGKQAKAVDREKITFVIEADGNTGKDRFTSRDAENEAQAIFELAARGSIKK
jgi:GWxTD domain-containing protein